MLPDTWNIVSWIDQFQPCSIFTRMTEFCSRDLSRNVSKLFTYLKARTNVFGRARANAQGLRRRDWRRLVKMILMDMERKSRKCDGKHTRCVRPYKYYRADSLKSRRHYHLPAIPIEQYLILANIVGIPKHCCAYDSQIRISLLRTSY